MNQQPYNMPQHNSVQGNYARNPYSWIISSLVGNMRFLGTITIIWGSITCISVMSAIIGIPMIFAGIRLRESADYFADFVNSNLNNESLLSQALERQNRYFNIIKILIIIGIIFVVVFVIFLFSALSEFAIFINSIFGKTI